MNKLNTTQKAVEELKHKIKTELVEPTILLCNKYISLEMKIFLSIATTMFMLGWLMYSLYQGFNM